MSLAACGSIYANKIVPVRHNAHYSAFVYSACTESEREREYGILLNLCTFNYLGYVVQQSNINAVLHCLKHKVICNVQVFKSMDCNCNGNCHRPTCMTLTD